MKLFVIICFVWFFILLAADIVFFIKAVRKGDNATFGRLFAFCGMSIASAGILCLWGWYCERLDWDVLILSLAAIIAAALYLVVCITGVIVKLRKKPEGKLFSGNGGIKPIIVTVAIISVLMCIAEFAAFGIGEAVDKSQYNSTKEETIDKLAGYLNEKYDLSLTASDCVLYIAQNYQTEQYFMSSHTFNIPYVAVFEHNGEYITATDRKGFLSDNAQFEELGYILGEYLGAEYAVVRDIHNGNIQDYTISRVLQTAFNEKITADTADELFEAILLEEDLEILLYVKEESDLQAQTSALRDKLSKIRDEENVERVAIYIYDSSEELIVRNMRLEPDSEGGYQSFSDDYYDNYKFGCCYVPNDIEYFYPEGSIFDGEIFNTFVDYIEFN